jgi:DNA-binding NtrC family response regulator
MPATRPISRLNYLMTNNKLPRVWLLARTLHYLGQEDAHEVIKMDEKTKILVVDDEEVVRLSHIRTLASVHCDVEVVKNGAEALGVMEQRPADVVLLDLRMPGMDGMAVLKTIKQRWPETEVVIITGYPNVDTAKEAVRLGAYDYLAKPIGPDEVINVANGAMTQKKWALHKDRTGSDAGIGSVAASSWKANSFTN